MDAFNKWIYTIVVVMVFTTFIEILMPNSTMKKYTKVVLGLLVMTIILNPILSILKKDFSLSGYSFKFQSQLDSIYLKNQSADYSEEQSKAVTKLYRHNLETQIESQIKKEITEQDIKVKVDINEDVKSDSYCEIIKITLIINDQIKSVNKVKEIDISGKGQEDYINTSNNYQNIKNIISAMYNIDKDRIEIGINE